MKTVTKNVELIAELELFKTKHKFISASKCDRLTVTDILAFCSKDVTQVYATQKL